MAIWRITSQPSRVLETLRESLENPDGIRTDVILCLAEIGPHAMPLVPLLEPLLEDRGSSSTWYVAAALWRIDRRAEDTLPHLIDALEGQYIEVLGIRCLGEIGARATAALPHLERYQNLEYLGQARIEAARESLKRITEELQRGEGAGGR